MTQYRSDWLLQVRTDFAWGMLALLAWHRGDAATAGCWMREAGPLRDTPHWTLTDAVAWQILVDRRVQPAPAGAACT